MLPLRLPVGAAQAGEAEAVPALRDAVLGRAEAGQAMRLHGVTMRALLKHGPKWHQVSYSRGSGQFPGGNPHFTGIQPPALLIPCEDGTCQSIYLGVPMLPDAVCYCCEENPCVCGAAETRSR